MQIRDLRQFTTILAAMVVIDALSQPIILLTARIFPAFFMANIAPIANGVDLGALIFKIVTMIVFSVWIYLAGRNLLAAGFDDLEFTPGSRIWWFFIPVASLFKPFQGMRELSNASEGVLPRDANDGLISIWWALWLVNNLIGLVVGRSNTPDAMLTWASAASDIAVAVAAILLIRRIAEAQSRLDSTALEEVFA